MTKTVSILGSTGVIGQHSLSVVDHLEDQVQVTALAAGRNVRLLAEQVRRYVPQLVAVADANVASELRAALCGWRRPLPAIVAGEEGLRAVGEVDSDVVLSAIVGSRGILPTWHALQRGATVGLANKESMVAAGDLMIPLAAKHGATIIPVDSEHAAIYQCLLAGSRSDVSRLLLTASGGPFRTWSRQEIAAATPEQALQHPNWTMGPKNTIDSATLMNKGLEVIEAHHLFAVPYDTIDVLVHPQSLVHSLVQYDDGTVVAQIGPKDMRVPIQFALTSPRRQQTPAASLDWKAVNNLTFEMPDADRFPSLAVCYQAGQAGGYAPCVLNAANEVAVAAFLSHRLHFCGIARLVEAVLEQSPGGRPQQLDDILLADAWARRTAHTILEKGGWTS